jgi:RNA polymerase sigma-70 factor, ECF subfamily
MSIDSSTLDPSETHTRYVALFEAHFADIWKFVRRRCGSSHDADDVTAETFAVAWRRRDELPGDDVRLWLFGVARRVLANQRRSAQRQERVRLRLAETTVEEVSVDVTGESTADVRRALETLSEDERDLLIMQAWDGLSIGEMAVLLGCSGNAVSLRLFKARRKLARELSRKGNLGSGHVPGESLSAEGGAS